MGRTKNANPKRSLHVTVTERRNHEDHETTAATIAQAESLEPRRKKQVTFARELESTIDIPLIENTEATIVEEDPTVQPEVTVHSHSHSEWTLEIQSDESAREESNRASPFLLRQYDLSNTSVSLGSEENGVNLFAIRTAEGAATLVKHCEGRFGNKEKDWRSVGVAVEDGTMSLICTFTNTVLQVSLWLNQLAFEVSCPSNLPITTRRNQWSKKQIPCRNLRLALGSLFPQSVIADVAKPQSSSSSESITAKMIYDVTDNVQLLAQDENRKPFRDIPGLVPTLRPYQEEAVEWMLKREKQQLYTARGSPIPIKSDEKEGREWEMAWVVLVQETSETNSESQCQRQGNIVVPLYEWNKQQDSEYIFYSPFAGWLAKSVQEAHAYSIQSVYPDWDPSKHSNPYVSGGILADSMGLGKTVEVLACILANPLKTNDKGKSSVVRNLDFSTDSDQEEKKQDDNTLEIVKGNVPPAKRQRTGEAQSDETSHEENDSGVGNFDYCHECEKVKGGFLFCAECPRAFHHGCTPQGDDPVNEDWVCHVCKEEQATSIHVDGTVSVDTIAEAYDQYEEADDFDAGTKILSITHEIVTTLEDHEFGTWFRRPVDCDEVPGYAEAISNPMDLGTIASDISSGEYGNRYSSWNEMVVSILTDLELVWHNCFVFYDEGSYRCKMAKVLRQQSQRMQKDSLVSLLAEDVVRRVQGAADDFEKMRISGIEELSTLQRQATVKKKVSENYSDYASIGECLCGHSGKSKKTLSMVVCRSCFGPMHGVCAGFTSEKQLREETQVGTMKNQYTHEEFYCRMCNEDHCPCCAFSRDGESLIQSRATLIVAPPSIISQWEREIKRHTAVPMIPDASAGASLASTGLVSGERDSESLRPLNVLVYPGVRELCNNAGHKPSVNSSEDDRPKIHLIHPRVLADADIVLMPFQALMGDLTHSADNPFVDSPGNRGSSQLNLRKRKRFRVVPSPLTSINWWRICLDEAQRVETPTAASAQMALKLQTTHRWCVSGTPVGKGKLEDLYGLVLFLGLTPFSSSSFYSKCLQSSHQGVMARVKHLLQTVFWRSTKSCPRVKLEMGVPEQVEKKVFLRFSSIERHFYERQLEETLSIASTVAGMRESNQKATQIELLAAHLHRLRAACCHPQVGSRGVGRQKKSRKSQSDSCDNGYGSVNINSGVLTMDQILDRLIDDAKTKCEEAQRLAVMHKNALACLSRLKVDARGFGISVDESDKELLTRSCEAYQESLDLMDTNAEPSAVVGESMITGCTGFRRSREIVRDGKAILDWQLISHDACGEQTESHGGLREVWARIDFEGPSKKLVQIRIQPIRHLPAALYEERGTGFHVLRPKDCILQVSSASVGGMFVDVVRFTLPASEQNDTADTWLTFGGFRTNKSKSWRLLVKNYHGTDLMEFPPQATARSLYVGVEVELMEASIAMDTLPRLHVLHNLSLSLSSLLEQGKQTPESASDADGSLSTDESGASADVKTKMLRMKAEAEKIESLYMDAARTVHGESQRQLQIAMEQRRSLERDLLRVKLLARKSAKNPNATDSYWDDAWWDDLLSACHLHASISERLALCDKVAGDLNDFYADTVAGIASKKRFPQFHNAGGLKVALSLYIDEVVTQKHSPCIESVTKLSANPEEDEIVENSHCKVCREDWNQKGPKCRHCKLEDALEQLENDPVLLCVLNSLSKWTRESKTTGALRSAMLAAKVDERAKLFFKVVKAAEKERLAARAAWSCHFDLLSDVDELIQCKQTMRLAHEGEDLSDLTEEEQNFIVAPCDIAAKCMDHEARNAMALGDLRRCRNTLRYLKNQNAERREERRVRKQHRGGRSDAAEDRKASCVVCLNPLDGDRAVLGCGHSFHYSPCLENIMKRGFSRQTITCPLRCSLKTKREDVLIATDKRKDDGSRSRREVKGSWGTKVTRLVSDVMDVSDRGEKGIVFSQWEDMLEVVEQALAQNNVHYVRATSLVHIGESLKSFRSSANSVLLLNVKNAGEGLTLVEATHVFMVEPLLNCGLDSQAINRIHRIGQACKTYVHRYVIEDTVEVKIDKMRSEKQDDQIEDLINNSKVKQGVRGGGIDGGLSQAELHQLLH